MRVQGMATANPPWACTGPWETALRPLAGATAWLVTDGKAGHEAQALGIAEALGVAYTWRRVPTGGLSTLLAPWGPPPSAFDCAPPWPDIAIGIGRTAMPALRHVGRRAGPATYTVALQDPRTSSRIADLIWVPVHDRRRGPNVVTTLTPPNRFTPELIARLRAEPDAAIDALPGPRVMLALGGAAKVWRFEADDLNRLAEAIAMLGAMGTSFLATPSRRTPPAIVAAVRAALAPFPNILYAGEGDNPYPRFLAKADAIVVTADSVSMTGEAVATGRPVYVFRPSGGSAKFERFHRALLAAGASRSLDPGSPIDLDWSHPPINAAREIAEAIEQRWQNRARYLSGRVLRGED